MTARIVALLLVVGCGHASGGAPRVPSARATLAVGQLSVVVVPAASEGLVRASLWIDAGTRDGGATATLAAWAASGPALRARATPDAIELSVRGEARELGAMLDALASALGTRALEASAHAELRARLEDAQRRAAAHPALRADALALQAALGAHAFAGEPSRDDVEAFLAAHFGPSRALLVVVGDATERDVERAARVAFGRLPSARAPRPRRDHARGLTPPEAPLVGDPDAWAAMVTEDGARFAATLALTVDDAEEAWGIARALRASSSTVFPHRTGATVLLRVESPAALPALVTRARLLEARARRPPEASGVDAIPERIALEWLGHEGGASIRRLVVGAVGLAAGSPRFVDRPSTRRATSADVTRATAENGARGLATRREGATAIALRFRTGGVEPARAQLLAVALASRCEALAPVVPHVDEDAFALVMRVPEGRWREAADALARCAMGDPGRTEGHRLRLLAARRAAPERGWIARAIAPGAHGLVEPRGTDDELSGPLPLPRFAEEVRVGARATFAVVGPVDAPEAAEHLAMLLSWLPPGEAATSPRWGEPLSLDAREWPGDQARVVIAWRVDGTEPGRGLVAQAFAAEAAGVLARVGEVVWHEGGRGEHGAWAAVALELPSDRLDAFDIMRRRVRAPTASVVARRVDEARWAGSDPVVAALRLGRDGSARTTIPTAEVIGAVGSGLARSEPAIVIGRPRR